MDFAKRAANAYQFALEDSKHLKSGIINEHFIKALVMLAIEDIEYGKNIAGVIEQQLLKVRINIFIFIFILILILIFLRCNLIVIFNLKHFKNSL